MTVVDADLEGRELSLQQSRIVDLVAQGMSNREVGVVLHMAEDTVKTHMRRINKKLGSVSRAHAVALVLRKGEPTGYAERIAQVRGFLDLHKGTRRRAPEGSLFAVFYDQIATALKGGR
jgi:DNA-binding CsgD family transcriptional regulator